MTWDAYFLDLAAVVATKSKDPSTRVGCVVVDPATHQVLTTGFNGLPIGVADDPGRVPRRYERPLKYRWTEHAERNAVYLAARHGTALAGGTLYCTHPPCADCARAIVQAGIRRVVVAPGDPIPGFQSRWAEDAEVARQILTEAGVDS